MKGTIAVLMVLAFLFSFTTPLLAMPDPVGKLKDGIEEIVTSPMELPKHVTEEVKSGQFLPFALMGGILKGTAYTVKQFTTGVIHVVTIPIGAIKK